MKFKRNVIRYVTSRDEIPAASLRSWTVGAIECYKLKGDCFMCPVADIMETHCNMKFSVEALIEKFGKPTNKLYERLLNEEKRRLKTWQ